MGNRANFVVVENNDWRLHYAHWAGYRMLDALIGGPDLALRYANGLKTDPRDQWTHPLWVDGGALIDLDRRRLLFFGDELMVSMNERRAMLAAVGALWPGYATGWAYDGSTELAGYVGAEHVLRWRYEPSFDLPIELATDRDKLCQVVSVRDADGRLRFWPVCDILSQSWYGPGLLDALPGSGLPELQLDTLPEAGVHLDVGRKAVGEWHTADMLGIGERLPALWPGWHTESWGDRFEEQADRCGRALRLPALDLSAGARSARDWLRTRIYHSYWDRPFDSGAWNARPTHAEWERFSAVCDALIGREAESA